MCVLRRLPDTFSRQVKVVKQCLRTHNATIGGEYGRVLSISPVHAHRCATAPVFNFCGGAQWFQESIAITARFSLSVLAEEPPFACVISVT